MEPEPPYGLKAVVMMTATHWCDDIVKDVFGFQGNGFPDRVKVRGKFPVFANDVGFMVRDNKPKNQAWVIFVRGIDAIHSKSSFGATFCMI